MRNRSFWRMLGKFLVALEGTLPAEQRTSDTLLFKKPCSVQICTDGECEKLENVSKIDVSKSGKGLRVVKA